MVVLIFVEKASNSGSIAMIFFLDTKHIATYKHERIMPVFEMYIKVFEIMLLQNHNMCQFKLQNVGFQGVDLL